MQALLRAASEHVEQLTLMVVKDNLAALALYRACGFEVYGIEPRALKSAQHCADEVLRVRFLGAAPARGATTAELSAR